jgi:hypothetical protein
MIVESIYTQLKEKHRRLSKSQFCREYLNKDRNYWFVCRYNNTDISDTALMSLYGNLVGCSNTWFELAKDASNQAVEQYERNYLFNLNLADTVLEEIKSRALT